MKIELFRKATESAVFAVVESRRWVPGEFLMVVELDRRQLGGGDLFGVVLSIATFDALTKRGFGATLNLAEWGAAVRDLAQGSPVIYSLAPENGATFHRALVVGGKVVDQ